MNKVIMNKTQKIYCPNCGSDAQRHYYRYNKITKTTCPVCDYLMVNCSQTGKVLESYAPGIYSPGIDVFISLKDSLLFTADN